MKKLIFLFLLVVNVYSSEINDPSSFFKPGDYIEINGEFLHDTSIIYLEIGNERTHPFLFSSNIGYIGLGEIKNIKPGDTVIFICERAFRGDKQKRKALLNAGAVYSLYGDAYDFTVKTSFPGNEK